MLTCPEPPPLTLVTDPGDDVAHTRAALADHNPTRGRTTVHPTPGTHSTLALAHDILAALGKPVPLTGYRALDTRPAWILCAAWILAQPITRLTILRAHLLEDRCLDELLALRARTGLHLTLVCHHPRIPAPLERVLNRTSHHHAEAAAVLSHEPTTHEQNSAPATPTRRWINLPALATLPSPYPARPCTCRAKTAHELDHTPPALTPATEHQLALRLHTATAHPHLAAELATVCFTAPSRPQLNTVRVADVAPDAEAVTLHDPQHTRHGCIAHPAPPWARPLLRAAVFTHLLAGDGRSGLLFTDSLGTQGLPHLTEFAEHCKLRPLPPPGQRFRTGSRQLAPAPTGPRSTRLTTVEHARPRLP